MQAVERAVVNVDIERDGPKSCERGICAGAGKWGDGRRAAALNSEIAAAIKKIGGTIVKDALAGAGLVSSPGHCSDGH